MDVEAGSRFAFALRGSGAPRKVRVSKTATLGLVLLFGGARLQARSSLLFSGRLWGSSGRGFLVSQQTLHFLEALDRGLVSEPGPGTFARARFMLEGRHADNRSGR